MGWRVTSKKNDGNIKFIFENGNIDSKTGSNWVIASPIIISRGPPPPTPRGPRFDPVFTVDVTVFEDKFDVTAFDVNIFVVYVPVFDVSYFPQKYFIVFLIQNWFSFIFSLKLKSKYFVMQIAVFFCLSKSVLTPRREK